MIEADANKVKERLRTALPEMNNDQISRIFDVLEGELWAQEHRFRAALNMVRQYSMGFGIKRIMRVR